MNNIALIVIYNHRYDKNIEIIEKIYKNKFSDIYHLVPFYDGNKGNVIPVYENSFCFQGYVAQGFKYYFKEKYSHYFFIADDMILNPVINQDNCSRYFKLTEKTCFISSLTPLSKYKYYWIHNAQALVYDPYMHGVELKGILPSKIEAEKRIGNYCGTNINSAFPFKRVYRSFFSIKEIAKYFIDRFIKKASLKGTKYPMVMSYSDIFIVSKETMPQFIQWLYGYRLGFTNATVVQKRNPHDYFKDFISEIPMYQHCENIINIVASVINKDKSICHNLYEAYRDLNKAEIVNAKEFEILDAWLKDITKYS